MTKRLHYFSGLTIALFVALHLVNHLMLLRGEQAHIDFMTTTRIIYRNPISETILLIAVVVQVVSGLKLVRTKWKNSDGIFEKLHIYSGLFLSYFLVAHVGSVLMGRFVFKLDTNLYFGAGVLVNSLSVYYFVFHYGLAIISFFMHIACVHKLKIVPFITERQARIHAYVIICFGVVLSLLIVTNMMSVNIPIEYQYVPFGQY